MNTFTAQGLQMNLPVFFGHEGESNNSYEAALVILQKVIQKEGEIRFGIEKRSRRQISLMRSEELLISNIFQLSTGETALLNLFLSILRDWDYSSELFPEIGKIRGIVIIDEIDLHLHVNHQRKVLPELIKLFPNIQL